MTDFNFLNKVFVMNLEKRIKYGLHAPIFWGVIHVQLQV